MPLLTSFEIWRTLFCNILKFRISKCNDSLKKNVYYLIDLRICSIDKRELFQNSLGNCNNFLLALFNTSFPFVSRCVIKSVQTRCNSDVTLPVRTWPVVSLLSQQCSLPIIICTPNINHNNHVGNYSFMISSKLHNRCRINNFTNKRNKYL